MAEKGILVVVSGFSGAGKGTLMKRLMEKYDNYALSVSATTRAPRPGEEHGREYFFHTKQEFEELILQDALIEYAQYVENYYGTPKAYVENPIQFGASVRAVPYIQGTRKPVGDILEFIRAHESVLDGVDIITGDQELKTRLWQLLDAEAEDVYITSSVAQLLEISYKDAGKHTGAAFLLDHLGLDREELAAFGDGDNDAELLAFAGIGIAVENASRKCKDAADYITLSNEACGVAYGIRNILKL